MRSAATFTRSDLSFKSVITYGRMRSSFASSVVLSAKASNSSHARMRADALAVPLREDTTIVRKMRVPSSTDFPEVREAWCW